MTGPESKDPPEDQLMREAAGWFARMRGPDSENSRDAFEAWLRRGAVHRGAYNRAAEIFAMGKLLANTPAKGAKQASGKALYAASAVLASLLAIVLLAVVIPRLGTFGTGTKERLAGDGGEIPYEQVLSAPPGQARGFTLPDGSRLRIDGGSVVQVRMSRMQRQLELKRGKALFSVFHEPRPFIVLAGGGSITARGTLFEVALDDARRVTVRLMEGTVDVSLPTTAQKDRPAPAVKRLRPGMSLSFDAPPGIRELTVRGADRPSVNQPGSTNGAREFDSIAVNDLIAEANRGSPRPIRLADPAVGARKVSGWFRIDDSALLAERLALLFDLAVDRDDPRVIVLRRR